MRVSLSLIALALAASCGATASPSSPPAEPVAPPVAEAPADLQLAGELGAIGRPCDEAGGSVVCGASTACACGERGRVAMVSMPLDVYGWRDPAPFSGPTCTIASGTSPRAGSLSGTATTRHVWIRYETCPRCARQMGLAAVLEPAAVDSARLAAFQRSLGLAAEPLLRTPDDWLAALRALPDARCE